MRTLRRYLEQRRIRRLLVELDRVTARKSAGAARARHRLAPSRVLRN